MKYRRMPIEIESPEQHGYDNIKYNLTESSVTDMALGALNADLGNVLLSYENHIGKPALRELIAAEAHGLCADDVLLTAGAAAALFIIATSLLAPGDNIVAAHPNYATNIETPRAIGCDISFLNLRFEEGFKVDIKQLESLINERTKLVSLTCPHNPTGAVMSERELRDIIALVEKSGAYLLMDETYREMNVNGALPAAASLSTRAISVSSLSKSFGLPGVRLGWLITRDTALQETFLAAKEQIYICNSIVDEEIAFAFYKEKDKHWLPIKDKIAKAFQILKQWMAAEPKLEWVEPEGGVVCFPRIREDAGVDVDEYYQILNDKYGTFVGPGHWFEMDRRHFRIGYGWPALNELEAGLECISSALADASV